MYAHIPIVLQFEGCLELVQSLPGIYRDFPRVADTLFYFVVANFLLTNNSLTIKVLAIFSTWCESKKFRSYYKTINFDI